MKTGLGICRKWRLIYSYYNLFRFSVRKRIIGFDVANQFIQRLDNYSLQLILKRNGAFIGKNCDIETGLTFHNCKNYKNLIIGDNCHIGKNCFFDLRDKIIIGNNVVISMQCSFITHIDLGHSILTKNYPKISSEIIIDNETYIGIGTIVLQGVKIGNSSILAAGSVVTKNIEDLILAGGVPARKIKFIG